MLLVGADRVALLIAERQAATEVQNSQGLSEKPSVSISGFPFLTQFLGGRFERVTAHIAGLMVGEQGRSLRIGRLDAQLNRVHTSRDFSTAVADTATAQAVIAYADLSKTLGVQVSYGGGSGIHSRVKATESVTVAGQQFGGSVSAEVTVSGSNILKFESPHFEVGGADVPPAVTDALSAVFSAPLPLTGLPAGLAISSVTASPTGITIALAGNHVTLSRDRAIGGRMTRRTLLDQVPVVLSAGGIDHRITQAHDPCCNRGGRQWWRCRALPVRSPGRW